MRGQPVKTARPPKETQDRNSPPYGGHNIPLDGATYYNFMGCRTTDIFSRAGDNRSMFDYLRGLALILAFQALGWLLQRLGVPMPGGVLGLLALFLALKLRLVKLAWVDRMAGLLLRHMVLLFVPLTVGLMEMGHVLQRQAVALLASLVVSWAAVFLTTGLLGQWLLPTVQPRPDEAQQ